MLDRALAIEPDDVETKVARAFVEFDWKADTRPVASSDRCNPGERSCCHAKDSPMTGLCARWQNATPAAAANALAALGENTVGDETVQIQPRISWKALLLG